MNIIVFTLREIPLYHNMYRLYLIFRDYNISKNHYFYQ